jgi:hypothetical protein
MGEFISWLEGNMLQCFNKQLFGLECPGCGMQRSLIALLKGDYYESFILYPPLSFIIGLMMLLVMHLSFRLKHGASVIKWYFILTTFIVIANFIFKNIH